MKVIKSISVACILSSLIACGGGSGQSTTPSASNPPSTTTPPPTIPPENPPETEAPVEHTLKVTAVSPNRCQVETPITDAVLLIHNEDYTNKEVIHANDYGELSYTTTNEFETISIVVPKAEIDGVVPIEMKTMVSYPSTDLGKVYFEKRDFDGCICETTNLVVNTPDMPNETAQSVIVSGENVFWGARTAYVGYAEIEDVQYCKNSDGSWPTFSVQLMYPNTSYAAVVDKISTINAVDATLMGVPVLTNAAPNLGVGSDAYNGNSYILSGKDSRSGVTYFYPNEATAHHRVIVEHYTSIGGIGGKLPNYPNSSSPTLINKQFRFLTDINQMLDVELEPINYENILNVFTSDSADYDLTDVANWDNIIITIEANNRSLFFWQIYAPSQGTLPQLSHIDLSPITSLEEINAHTNNITINLYAEGYEGVEDYQDYVTHIINRQDEDLPLPKWSNQKTILFFASFADENLSFLNSMNSEDPLPPFNN